MSWIEKLVADETDANLETAYARVREADGSLCNLYKPYGHRPHILFAADQLHKATLHSPDNKLEPWVLELVGTHVACLTGCAYAAAHHGHNFRVLLDDEALADAILETLTSPSPELEDERLAAILAYSGKLTVASAELGSGDIEALRRVGLEDGEILEVNQVAASFNYWIRTINGLGIALDGEAIGFY